jgi:hypothetical protein
MVATPDQNRTVKKALHSLLAYPVLKILSFELGPFPSVELHNMATDVLKRHTHPSTEQRSCFSSFRFMDLPVEIQLMILKYTALLHLVR